MEKLKKLIYFDKNTEELIINTLINKDNCEYDKVSTTIKLETETKDFDLVSVLIKKLSTQTTLNEYDKKYLGWSKRVMQFLVAGNHIEIVTLRNRTNIQFVNYKNLSDSFLYEYKASELGQCLKSAIELASKKLNEIKKMENIADFA